MGRILGGIGPQVSSCRTSRSSTIARFPGTPEFPWFPKFSAAGPKEPFLRYRQLEPEGHVSDGARGRLLPSARRCHPQRSERGQSLGFRQGDRIGHHLGLWALHVRLSHRPHRRADQVLPGFLARFAGGKARDLRDRERTADDAFPHLMRHLRQGPVRFQRRLRGDEETGADQDQRLHRQHAGSRSSAERSSPAINGTAKCGRWRTAA